MSQAGQRAGWCPARGYVSKTDMVAALIREQIITGELTAGEQLRQRDLAAAVRGQPDPGARGDARGWSPRGWSSGTPTAASPW